jgi:hypothetical protein
LPSSDFMRVTNSLIGGTDVRYCAIMRQSWRAMTGFTLPKTVSAMIANSSAARSIVSVCGYSL